MPANDGTAGGAVRIGNPAGHSVQRLGAGALSPLWQGEARARCREATSLRQAELCRVPAELRVGGIHPHTAPGWSLQPCGWLTASPAVLCTHEPLLCTSGHSVQLEANRRHSWFCSATSPSPEQSACAWAAWQRGRGVWRCAAWLQSTEPGAQGRRSPLGAGGTVRLTVHHKPSDGS